ncbi:MAG TPA: glycosyltransferase [Blastocatellia bacterium]|jgi:glycosyltransferase involved in cell wall biosynthesis
MNEQLDISVIISTYNRSDVLPGVIESLLAQEADGVSFEVVIVDNNSTDGTSKVIESFKKRGERNVRSVFEPRQGVSYGRNAGIQATRAPVLAFTDDDVQVTRNWVATIKRAFDKHPQADYIGGKVLPDWQTSLPLWATRDHWAPLAIMDYGDTPFYVSSERRLCLLGANLAFRRSTLDAIGLFAPDLQRVKDGIGSMEDLEIQLRAWSAGKQGLYVPELAVTTEVPANRLTKAYHRRWHTGHGHFYAMLRLNEMEQSDKQRLFDVPAHLYRQAGISLLACLKHCLSRDFDQAFTYETQIRFFSGFFRQRRFDYLTKNRRSSFKEIKDSLRALMVNKSLRHRDEHNSR